VENKFEVLMSYWWNPIVEIWDEIGWGCWRKNSLERKNIGSYTILVSFIFVWTI